MLQQAICATCTAQGMPISTAIRGAHIPMDLIPAPGCPQAAAEQLLSLKQQLESQRQLAEANLNPKRPGARTDAGHPTLLLGF